MKKPLTTTLLATLAVAFVLPLVGCSSTGSSSGSGWDWCRSGSLWPTSRRTEVPHQIVYAGQQCDPCTPNACQPCEPVSCNPCDPVCDPCKPRTTSYVPITPAPYGG